MFTTNLNDYQAKKEEMLRQAENYRLVRTVMESNSQPSDLIDQIAKVIDKAVLLKKPTPAQL